LKLSLTYTYLQKLFKIIVMKCLLHLKLFVYVSIDMLSKG